ncbi:MAG: hypothetical protein KF788_01740 [Piscinibacter sp.]|nr:hypothetical protein [Piscinibacter sp.]
MTQLLALTRPLSLGWVALAQRLAGAPQRRRQDFALTEPLVFRSECFAEDLPAAPPLKPMKHGRPVAKRG